MHKCQNPKDNFYIIGKNDLVGLQVDQMSGGDNNLSRNLDNPGGITWLGNKFPIDSNFIIWTKVYLEKDDSAPSIGLNLYNDITLYDECKLIDYYVAD